VWNDDDLLTPVPDRSGEQDPAPTRSRSAAGVATPCPTAPLIELQGAPEFTCAPELLGGEPAGLATEDAAEPAAAPLGAADDVPAAAVAAPSGADPAQISWSRLLEERPDVLKGFYESFHGPGNDRHSPAWMQRVGGDTPEAYARYWYSHFGKFEGYNQGPTTAADNVSVEQILRDRPDVLRGFYEAYYGPGNDRHSDAWLQRVGDATPEAYARYWYEKHGKWEGYAQSDKAAAESVDVERLLVERPDVFRAFYEQYYGPDNDRHSSAWRDRVGGETVQDYAKYWYVTYGRHEGYTQHPSSGPGPDGPTPDTPSEPDAPVHDPAEDPWNHGAIFPDWQPPYEGWSPPPNIWHPDPAATFG
jgi:hypothetical protein